MVGRWSKAAKLVIGSGIILLSLWFAAGSVESFLNPLKMVSEVTAQPDEYLNRSVQVVGWIVPGSWRETEAVGTHAFRLTDGNATLTVLHTGDPLPTSVKPDTGVTAIGVLTSEEVLRSNKVLLKCPTKYQQDLLKAYNTSKN
jgi:cytochrome c-type biogenesis protein CcmE